MALDYRQAAQEILDAIGGPGNVVSAAHCATRLRLVLADDAITVSWDGTELALRFSDDAVGCGRTERTVPCDRARDLRVLVDGSAVEVFAAGGRAAMATRWFPRADSLTVRAGLGGRRGPLADGRRRGDGRLGRDGTLTRAARTLWREEPCARLGTGAPDAPAPRSSRHPPRRGRTRPPAGLS